MRNVTDVFLFVDKLLSYVSITSLPYVLFFPLVFAIVLFFAFKLWINFNFIVSRWIEYRFCQNVKIKNEHMGNFINEQNDIEFFNYKYGLKYKDIEQFKKYIAWVNKYKLSPNVLSKAGDYFDADGLTIKPYNVRRQCLLIFLYMLACLSICFSTLFLLTETIVDYSSDNGLVFYNRNYVRVNHFGESDISILTGSQCEQEHFDYNIWIEKTGFSREDVSVLCGLFVDGENSESFNDALFIMGFVSKVVIFLSIIFLIYLIKCEYNRHYAIQARKDLAKGQSALARGDMPVNDILISGYLPPTVKS